MLEEKVSIESMDQAKPSKRWIVPTTIIIVFIIVLSVIFWPKTEDERLPTLQEIEDAASDPLGWGFPTEYPQLEPGETVEIMDQIIDIWYGGPPGSQVLSSYMIIFSYKDGIWPSFNSMNRTWAHVFDDIGPYTIGDWIRLVGVVVNETTPQGATLETIHWKVRGGPGAIIPPTIGLANTTSPCSDHVIEISEINRTNTIIHYQFRLFKGEVAVGDLDLKAGPLGLYMRFEDRGNIGFLDVGDRIHVTGLQPGNYTLQAKYAGGEIGNLPFNI